MCPKYIECLLTLMLPSNCCYGNIHASNEVHEINQAIKKVLVNVSNIF